MAKKGRKQSKIYTQHIIASAGIVLLAVMFVFVLAFFTDIVDFQFSQEVGEDQESQEPAFRHPLTGTLLYEEMEVLPTVYAVIVENHYEARPQSGLEEAFLVYEAPVEAGITRMLAFYSVEQEVEEIGPVRSARPYFVDWVKMFDALFAHVGGSPQALEQIKEDGTFDLNEYWYGGVYFWRSDSRAAPHNVYTSTDLLKEAQEELGGLEFEYESWVFKDSEYTSKEQVGIAIDFSIYDWNNVEWIFDENIGRYERYDQEWVHQTVSGESIYADNVVVIETDILLIDEIGRRSIEVLGSGNAYLVQDGRVVECEWQKETASDRLRLYRENQELPMNAGITWIQIVPTMEDVTIR
jgi:hypothetical protein